MSGGGGRDVKARNRRAFHDFEIVEKVEAGLVLLGPEVKVIREGKASIAEAYATIRGAEGFLRDMHVPEYSNRGYSPHDPKRPRKLLLHRRELKRLSEAIDQKGLTLVPLELYLKEGRVKVELGLARGRKLHDKREALRGEAAKREARRAVGKRR